MTPTISSPHNPRLREAQRLRRRRERARSGRFVAEGEDLVAAAQRAGRPALSGLCSAAGIAGAEGFVKVTPEALASVSSLGSGTRVLGVYEQRFLPAPVGPVCVYLHGVSDPGNVGTILRAAHAFGADCVALGPDCADPHSPKAVRASMGAIFAVALAHAASVAALPGERVALVAHAGEPLHELAGRLRAGPQSAVTLLVGAEREGLPPDLLAACEHRAQIAIRSDSLNAAMAASIALYEVTRGVSNRVPS